MAEETQTLTDLADLGEAADVTAAPEAAALDRANDVDLVLAVGRL